MTAAPVRTTPATNICETFSVRGARLRVTVCAYFSVSVTAQGKSQAKKGEGFYNSFLVHTAVPRSMSSLTKFLKCLFKKFFVKVLFIFERDRDSASGGGAERERETQNVKQAPGSEPSAQSLMQGSNPRTMRSRPELKSDA